jgi:hypothetical protein
MRIIFALAVVAGTMIAAAPAHAWYDRYGYWHPNYHRHWYRPPAYVVPRPYWRPRPYAYYHRYYGPPPGYYYYRPY